MRGVQCDSGDCPQVGILFTEALREAKRFAQGHTATLVMGLDLNPGLGQVSHLGTTLLLKIPLRLNRKI